MSTDVQPKPSVLLVGCDVERSAGLVPALRRQELRVLRECCGDSALDSIRDGIHDVVLLFACAGGDEGLRTLTRARASQCYAEFVVVGFDENARGAVEAFHEGISDYHLPPVTDDALVASVLKALRTSSLHREVARLRRRTHVDTPGGLVGNSRPMELVFDLIERVAPTTASVLITGETGTGKELVARAIHDLSPRRRKGFIPVGCATIPEHIMESTLFGHVRGAFTGAVENHRGLFEFSPGGTIFLDEIDTLEVELQAKLLRVLEERTIQRVGDRHDIPVDFRLVTASNADLQERLGSGTFREDLFYRLNVFPIRLPPLRDRVDDIPLLAIHFRDRFARAHGLEPMTIRPCCMERMLEHPWPGNVRELKNTVERAMLMSLGGDAITCESLNGLERSPESISWSRPIAEQWSLARLEESYIEAVMESTDGHKGQAAEILGIDRRTLYRKLSDREERYARDGSPAASCAELENALQSIS